MSRVVTIGASHMGGPMGWDFEKILHDPWLNDAFKAWAKGANVSEATLREMECRGGVTLSTGAKLRLQIVVRGHVAETRWKSHQFDVAEKSKAEQEASQFHFCEIARLADDLASHLRDAFPHGGPLLLDLVERLSFVADYSRAASARQLNPVAKRGRGKPRVHWEDLLACLARIYFDAGGTVSCARDNYTNKYKGPFFRFVQVLNQALPPEAQTSMGALFDRARKEKLLSSFKRGNIRA